MKNYESTSQTNYQIELNLKQLVYFMFHEYTFIYFFLLLILDQNMWGKSIKIISLSIADNYQIGKRN